MIKFPPHRKADKDGLLCIGGELSAQNLIHAYSNGIFPWPIDDVLAWFSPPQRAVLFFDELKISRTIVKQYRKTNFTFKVNTCFEEVIERCAHNPKRKQEGTWINNDIIDSYVELHRKGFAYSIECFNSSNLVGGLYGVNINGFISGESMFYEESGASKLSLLALVLYAKSKTIKFIDCQQLSPLVQGFGARLVSRGDFLKLLENSLDSAKGFSMPGELSSYLDENLNKLC